ncbi:PIR protein, putative [Plasmodium sp. gorilla clade G1]|nr:PIR protein, putative [Plasmodium sp. gorilla clade G1]
MKAHYINILLFAPPLNILVNTHKNPSTTPKIPTTRLLCACELYAPANYDNDPQMKAVMENFNKQTQQRFEEYDERIQSKRKQCNGKCDKEIQKIILKNKLEKQMAEKLTTLETKIITDDIPTCICEKSIADKVEKGCLRCGGVLGGGIAPSVGLLGGIGEAAISVLKPLALKAATKEAIAEATTLATNAGMKDVMVKIETILAFYSEDIYCVNLRPIVTPLTFKNGHALVETAKKVIGKACITERGTESGFCYTTVYSGSGEFYLGDIAKVGATTYEKTLTTETATLTKAKVGAVEAKYGIWQTANIAPVVAIVIIILVMVIIYLILRYRRKKKMKKKFQYIKLLEE